MDTQHMIGAKQSLPVQVSRWCYRDMFNVEKRGNYLFSVVIFVESTMDTSIYNLFTEKQYKNLFNTRKYDSLLF